MTNKNPVTFIHTADWHIGNTFSRFDRDKRKELKRAIFRTVELIFMYARKNDIPLILCAGDIIDNGQLSPKDDLIELFRIIKKYPGIRVVMIAGNHDLLINRNIYSQVEKDNYPKNLHLVEGDEELNYPGWNLEIFASSIREKNGSYNPLAWIKNKELDKGMINVGLCHGSIENEAFPGNDFPIESDFAQKQGLDYLALGDWHSFKKINQRTYYPGVPEPLQFSDDGFPLKVTIDSPGSIPKVEPITNVRQYQWNRVEEKITGETLGEFKTRLETIDEKEIRKLTVSGFLPVEKYKTYKELLAINRPRYFAILDKVIVQPGDQALLEIADGFMADVVRRLLELKKSGEPLPKGILNPYDSFERTGVHDQVEALRTNKEEIIDNALLKIYTYCKEKGQ